MLTINPLLKYRMYIWQWCRNKLNIIPTTKHTCHDDYSDNNSDVDDDDDAVAIYDYDDDDSMAVTMMMVWFW